MERTLSAVGLAAALVALSSPGAAQDKSRPVTRPLPVTTGAAPVAPTPPPPAPVAPPPVAPVVAAPVAIGVADAGVKEKGKEGAEQKKRRREHIDRVTKIARTLARADGVVTAGEKELIRQHGRRAMRTFRVRMLAEDEKDAATMARCDALLAKSETALVEKLQPKKGAHIVVDGGKK